MRGYSARTPEKVAEAQRLRAEGLTWREVGKRLGVSLKTAHEWATDPDRSKRIARVGKYDGVCVFCGGRTSGCDGPGTAADVCRTCLQNLGWNRDKVLAAIHEWADTHGGIPPRSLDWGNGGYSTHPDFETGLHPWASTVQRLFGSFNNAIEASGLVPHQTRDTNRFRPEVIAHVVERIQAGETSAAIAESLGISRPNLYVALQNRGYRIRELRDNNSTP